MVVRACPMCGKPVAMPAAGGFVCPHCDGELTVRQGKQTSMQVAVKVGLGVLAAAWIIAILVAFA